MDYFYKIFYDIAYDLDKNEISSKRFNYDSTIKTALKIKPINQKEVFELYYVPTNYTINIIEKIMLYDKTIENKYNNLPDIAKTKFLIDVVSNEIYNTNELEGVKSSKSEIALSTKLLILNKNPKNKKLLSMIKSYIEIIKGNFKLPNSPKDYRAIYDEITDLEIEPDEFPDGEIFRKDINYVYKNGKEIHRGLYPEKEIIDKTMELINFMNNKNNLNALIKIAIGHYYFGYIHPFYDGNGRTGRFISSLYIRDKFSIITALSLAKGCNINKSSYLKIFDVTNRIVSRGEMNYFVDEFLTTLSIGQAELLAQLNEKTTLLNTAYEKISNDPRITSEEEFKIMYTFIQDYYFSINDKGITVPDIVEVLKNTDITVRKKLKLLEEKSLIKKIKSNPLLYVLPNEYLEE